MALEEKPWLIFGALLFAAGCLGASPAAPSGSQSQSGASATRAQAPTPSPRDASPCPKGSDYKDGCSGASGGAPAFPGLLDGYRAPPPWNVAGVHYAVGVPDRHVLKDPRTADLPGGCSFRDVTVTCSGTVTLDGYDFSLHDGTTLTITRGNVTIRNSLFTVGTNQGALGRVVDVSGPTNASFLHNEFDGANIAVTPQRGQTISVTNAGTITFEYNYFHHSGGDMIDFGGGPQVNIVRYNMFKDVGLKTAHSDTLQWCGSIVSDSDLSFNTIVQTAPGLSGMGLLQPNSECSGARMSNLLVHNNTLISKVSDNFATGADVAQDAGPASADHVAVFNNYLDPTGIMNFTGSPWFPTGFYRATLPRPSALHSLVDMRTGSPLPVPSRLTSGSAFSRSFYVYPDASGYKPSLGDIYSISASPPSGTLSAGQTITLTLDMDEHWEVTGIPKLLLNSGGTANYSGGSGTAILEFTYRVESGQSATNLAITAVDLSGGTVKDAFGNIANLSEAVTTFPSLHVQ
jgi:hypothetical protein